LKGIIKNQEAKDAIARHPEVEIQDQKDHKQKIKEGLYILNERLHLLIPFVKKIGSKLTDITDESYLNAMYLLGCYCIQSLHSFFVLARFGQYPAALAVIRMIKETSMLMQHFTFEKMEGKDSDLKKWFGGDLVMHSAGRESTASMSEKNGEWGMNHKALSSYVYQIESLAPHSGYVTMLECISPFSEDFEIDGNTELYRTISTVKYANGTLTDFNVTLKGIYKLILGDMTNYKALDEILLKFDPQMVEENIDQKLKEKFPKNVETTKKQKIQKESNTST
jgi:hypothetical protein